MKSHWRGLIICIVIMVMIMMAPACTVPMVDPGESQAEQTLQAIYVERTVEAIIQATTAAQEAVIAEPTATEAATATAAVTEEAAEAPTATAEIIHTTMPGGPGWVSQYWLDTSSSSSASQNRAYGGDALNQNLLERPFTAQDMVYHPDVDLGRIEISQDATFYYFLLHLNAPDQDLNTLSAYYGVEIDINRDGRGDVLLWAAGDGNQEWNIDSVYVYRDSNNDVGGSHPLQADAPGYAGDSYDQILFSPQHLDDPDAAWKRADPEHAEVIQLAIKKSLLNNATTFMWNAWADGGVSDPMMFDYNDFFTLNEAGSPLSDSADYPLKALYLVDNTCRLAYGFTPTGSERGVCPVLTAGPTAVPTTDRPLTDRTPCDCSDFPNYTFIEDEECCVYCGYVWYGTQEFPCGLPAEPPPCNCSDYPNYTFITDEDCCVYCGYKWSGTQEFPCNP